MSHSTLTIAVVAATRPNYPKVAPILAALAGRDDVRSLLVDAGQHYDPELAGVFFEDLGIAEPDRRLGAGSGSHAEQTGRVMVEFERFCLEEKPDAVVVAGDVNATAACALVAAKLQIPLAHVEAGLRSGDRAMPEEVNRLVTDALADLLYTHCHDADANLRAAGVAPEKIQLVGNVMIDTLLRLRDRAERPPHLSPETIQPGGYGLVTLHRPALVDHPGRLGPLLDALMVIASRLPLVFPIHPRTLARMRECGLLKPEPGEDGTVRLRGSRLLLCPPMRYRRFLWLMDHARLVITDSGGVQEETTVLRVPCITVRETTERPITVTEGTNRLVGLSPTRLIEAVQETLASPMPDHGRTPQMWDGQAGIRIARHLVAWLRGTKRAQMTGWRETGA